MLYFAESVVIPAGLAPFGDQLWWMQNFALGNCFLGTKFDFELRKLGHVRNAAQNSRNPLKAISGVANFVFL
jgi:hypothetical protein